MADLDFEIGTGVQQFEAMADEQDVELTAGAQGTGRVYGFHLWLGVKAHGAESPAEVAFVVRDAEDDAELAHASYRVDLLDAGDARTAFGMRAVFEDCCRVEHRRVRIEAHLVDRDGRQGDAVRIVHAGACNGGLSDPTRDPCP